jgi:Tfp pilus assembly protein PilZ
MLPTRKSSPAPRRDAAVAVEVRVPSLGTAFGALAAHVRPDGVFLSTFHELAVGTAVIATLSLPDGPLVVDGVVVAPGDPAGQGIALQLADVDEGLRARLRAA